MEVHLVLDRQEHLVTFLSALNRHEVAYELTSVDGGNEFKVVLILADADDLSTLLIAHPFTLLKAHRLYEQLPATTDIVTLPYPDPYITPEPPYLPPGIWYGDGTAAPYPYLVPSTSDPHPRGQFTTSRPSENGIKFHAVEITRTTAGPLLHS